MLRQNGPGRRPGLPRRRSPTIVRSVCPIRCLLDADAYHHGIGGLDYLLIERSFALEIMVDRWPGQVGANRDFLGRGRVVSEFAEDLSSRTNDALASFCSLRSGGSPWPPRRRRHARILPTHLEFLRIAECDGRPERGGAGIRLVKPRL